jgi:hypothetical protein
MRRTNASTHVRASQVTRSVLLAFFTACCFTVGSVQAVAAQGTTLTGTWYHEGAAAERTRRYDAIDRATEDMHSLMRGRARDKLRAKTAPQGEVAITDEGGQVTILTRDRRVRFKTDGSPTRASGEGGAATIQAIRQKGQLVVTAQGQSGAQTTVYRLSGDRKRLTLNISITSKMLKKPLRYQVEYLDAPPRRTSTAPR